jgi:hypothetical protein
MLSYEQAGGPLQCRQTAIASRIPYALALHTPGFSYIAFLRRAMALPLSGAPALCRGAFF